jgi:hypothetical protein
MSDRKLRMIEIALANLVASGESTIIGMTWQIKLESGNILWIEPSDEGFVYQVYYEASEDCKEHYGNFGVIATVRDLRDLISEVAE